VRLRLILVARRRHHDRVGLLAYPCEDCRNTVPIYYCDACRGQYENDTTDQKLIAHFEAMEQFVSNRTIMRITEEIATKCDVLDLIIEEFLAAKNTLDGSYRVYEAPFEALNLFNLTIRHVEGVIALARRDLVMHRRVRDRAVRHSATPRRHMSDT
jgi:hypothetical protein